MIQLVRLYVGLRDKDNGLIHDDTDIYSMVTHYFHGATIYNATGVWQYMTGVVRDEPSRIIELIDLSRSGVDMDRVKQLALDLKDALNQETILVTSAPIAAIEI